ncbi:excisionase family DNA-binding protein [Flavobacterium sp.]|uniref:excisionase family DNA-binding protein n=1 Tax=Flavobacterium sp. TaxID=239 RepID=UPI00326321A2
MLEKKYFGIDALAEYINESKSAIYKKTYRNMIPFIKTGKKLLFEKEAIDKWLDQFRQPTIQEIRNEVFNNLKTK